MGCDIHMHVEARGDAKWSVWEAVPDPKRGFAEWDYNRWYREFAALAGVRGEGLKNTPERRGTPIDIAEETRAWFTSDEPDAHSNSWLTADEVKAIDHDWSPSMKRILDWAEKDAREVRIVFWFDC